MKIYRNIRDFKGVKRPVMTMGTFDGLHLGHQKILKHLKTIAKQEDGETVMLSFHPHPRKVLLRDDVELKLLITLEEKIELLEHFGIDHLIIYPFTKEFSRLSSADYVKDLLVGEIGVKRIAIGYDHRFGKNRDGDFSTLVELANTFEFEVEEIPAKDIDQINISSTKIRVALSNGDVKTASRYLGYSYFLSGKVVEGNKLGRTIGFPTANIKVENELKLIPANGVYTVEVDANGSRYKGMLNIGHRPTVDESDKTKIEVHLFDFAGELYNSTLKISFVDRIRDEIRFANLNALKLQLNEDKKKVLSTFNG